MTYKVLFNGGYKEYDVPAGESYANRFYQYDLLEEKYKKEAK